nr:uncharacterized protein LOC129253889 [Lytechinus pictus]
MLHEKIELLLCPKAKELDPEEPQPHIHIEYNGRIEDVLAATGRVKEFAIVAEGEVVAQTSDVLKAVCIVMAVHYVFNMSYHPKLNASLTFIQKVIMNMKDSSPNPKKVIKVLFQVNSKLNAAV